MCGLEELSKLSRDLARSSTQPCPEEFIKQTLIAHGFFKHTKSTGSLGQLPDKVSPERDKSRNTSEDKGKASCGISEEDKRRTTQLISLVKEGREVHKLREPRSLYTHHQLSPRNLPLWPLEVPCVKHNTNFSCGLPPHPEPFLTQDTEVISPKIRSNGESGSVVYSNPLGPEKFFTNARVGSSPGLHTPMPPSQSNTLQFESRFESGNLAKAVQVGHWDYELYLRYDLYTNKHTQWFYFSVSNMRQGQSYRFTIVNLYKAGSLYNEGMQPVMYSVLGARDTGIGWRRAGHSIKYFKTNLRRADRKHEAYHYGLTWSFTFNYNGDTCYFAHCYPYTYSDLQRHIHLLATDPHTSVFVKLRTLCHSVAGNSVPVLTITSPVQSEGRRRAKRAVVLTARIHPGETNGSWMMKGFLDFITGHSPDAKVLRDNFLFKVVPMLNPDGVIVGNYRCSLSGRDLNRNYRSKLKDSYPILWATKAMIKKLAEDREIVLYCDFHGHSKKQNVFIYGCDALNNPQLRLKSRVFPMMLSKNAPAMFSFKDSKFNVHKSKEGTGRVVVWREMGVVNSYTLEATFCGSSLGKMAGVQFNTRDLQTMGYHFCDTLLDYCDPDQSKVLSILRSLERDYRQAVLERLASQGRTVPTGVDPLDLAAELSSEDESSDIGSDSSESDGPPVHILVKEVRKKKKKKLKTRRERNKHKALLKLTRTGTCPPASKHVEHTQHEPHTTHQPILIPTAALEDTPAGDVIPIDSETPRQQQGHSELARNGGIPVFVQERIEERLKRRSELDLNKDHETDYMEAVAMEYMRQGVCSGLIQEATQQDPRHSVIVPRSQDCPMSITSMAIYENKPPTRPSSRLGNRSSLPQLAGEEQLPQRGAFASQYVANHLVRDEPSSQPQETMGVNATKNLATLSKLFRQLKPQPLHSGTCNARTKLLLQSSIRPEEQADAMREGMGRKPRLLSRAKFYPEAQPSIAVTTHTFSDKSLSGSDRLITARQSFKTEQQTLKIGDFLSNENVKLSVKASKTIKKLSKENLAVHDKRLEARPSTGMSALKASSSPLTSSWESFSAPKELLTRREEVSQPAADQILEENSFRQAEFNPQLPPTAEHPEPAVHYDALLKSLGLKQRKQKIPKSVSVPGPQDSLMIPPLPINHYSPSIKSASSKPHHHIENNSSSHSYNNSTSKTSSLGAYTDRAVKTHHTQHDTIKESLNEHKKLVGQAVDKQRRHKPKGLEAYPTLEEVIQGTREVPESSLNPVEKLLRGHAVADNYLPVSTHGKMFSSKPPSSYGPKPKPENGVVPATVSLMLGQRRPSTMMYSSLKPRPLLIHYYNKSNHS